MPVRHQAPIIRGMASPATITAAGLAAAIAADNNGLDLTLTHVALGSGKYAPTGGETALSSLKEFVAIGPGSSVDGDTLAVFATFPAGAYAGAPYTIGEIGFYAGTPGSGGVLFAVASAADANFGDRPGADTKSIVFTLNLSGVPSGSVTLQIDPDAGIAHKLLQDHEAEANPHPVYVPPAGVVETYYGSVPPAGRVKAAGQWLSRAAFPELWAFAQAAEAANPGCLVSDAVWAAGDVSVRTAFSTGDGSTTFRMPDLRGLSARYWDDGRGVDAGRGLASYQADQLSEHTHSGVLRKSQDPALNWVGNYRETGLSINNAIGDNTSELTDPAGSGEVRVKSVALSVCMTTGRL